MPLSARARLLGASLLLTAVAGCSGDDGDTVSTPSPQPLEAGVLQVCTDMPYAPFESMSKGKPVGFDVDLVQAVADRLELDLKMVDTGFDDIASGASLNKDECDVAISAMTITGERARVLDFSSPYFDAEQAMVVPGDSNATALSDLAGQRIGVQGGTTGELYLTDNAPDDAFIVPFEDAAAMDAAIRDGDVDAAVYDNTVVGSVVADNPDLHVVAKFDTGEQYGMAVARNGNDDLLRVINDVLASMREDGTYDEIFTEWFGSETA